MMFWRAAASCFLALMIWCSPVWASEDWRDRFPDMRLVGGGVLEVLFIDIYRLNLYARDGRFAPEKDFVLEFEYLTDVSKRTIINASVNELAKLDGVSAADIKSWERGLGDAIVDMTAGDRAAIVFTTGGRIVFETPGRPPVAFDDPHFATSYAAIWLGPRTAYPLLRHRLLGNKAP